MAGESAVPRIRRFRGELAWLDLEGPLTRRVRRAPFGTKIGRAIRRPGGIALEFDRDGRRYEVTLREGPDQVFRGLWHAKWDAGRKSAQESGWAECRLKPPGTIWTTSVHSDGIDFVGTWGEDDVDCWFGQLIPVEAPEDAE